MADASYQPKVYRKAGGNELVVASGGKITVESGGVVDNLGAVAGATIVVGAESTNVRAITVQLTDAAGADIAVRQVVTIVVLADANGDAIIATGGSTGIAIGTDGAILATVIAKKVFLVVSEADGDIDLTWTDTGTEVAYLAIVLPNGKMVIGASMANT